MGLSVVASATHLIPAVGPGDQVAHGRQRGILGRAARLRLGAANLGIAAISVGAPWGWELPLVVGALLVAVALGWSVSLIAAAVAVALRRA